MTYLRVVESMSREEAAAHWVAVMSERNVPDNAARMFEAWMGDPENAALYADYLALYDDDSVKAAAHLARQSGAWRRWVWRGAGAVAACAVLAVVAFAPWQQLLQGEPGVRYRTVAGQALSMRLPDGSRMSLSGDTQVSVRFSDGKREVELLRGEAFFDVAHDASRPFLVHSGDVAIRDIGTAFNVDRLPNGGAEVSVMRGLVRVENGTQMRDLHAGQCMTTHGDWLAASCDLSGAPDWLSGWFETDGVPMRRLVMEMNRFSPVEVRIVSASLGDQLVAGRFKVSDTEQVLKGLKLAYKVRVQRRAQTIDLMASAP